MCNIIVFILHSKIWRSPEKTFPLSNSNADLIVSWLVNNFGTDKLYTPQISWGHTALTMTMATTITSSYQYSISSSIRSRIGKSWEYLSHVLTDKASQATESEAFVSIKTLTVTEMGITLSGDSKQLGPVICSSDSTYPVLSYKIACLLYNQSASLFFCSFIYSLINTVLSSLSRISGFMKLFFVSQMRSSMTYSPEVLVVYSYLNLSSLWTKNLLSSSMLSLGKIIRKPQHFCFPMLTRYYRSRAVLQLKTDWVFRASKCDKQGWSLLICSP